MPKAFILEVSVVGTIPRSSAAPPGPETFQRVCFKALVIFSFSSLDNSSEVSIAVLLMGSCVSSKLIEEGIFTFLIDYYFHNCNSLFFPMKFEN